MNKNNITRSDRKKLLKEVEKNIITVPQDTMVDHSVGSIIILFNGRKNKELRLLLRDIIELVGEKMGTTITIDQGINHEGYIEFRFQEVVELNYDSLMKLLSWINKFLSMNFIGYQGYRVGSLLKDLYDHPIFRGDQNLG